MTDGEREEVMEPCDEDRERERRMDVSLEEEEESGNQITEATRREIKSACIY